MVKTKTKTKTQAETIRKPDRGVMYRRTKGNFLQAVRERAFASEWEKEAAPTPGGCRWGLVQELFLDGGNPLGFFREGARVIQVISRQDRRIAATVIQWLGSNVGWSFLETVLKQAGFKIVPIDDRWKTKIPKHRFKSKV